MKRQLHAVLAFAVLLLVACGDQLSVTHTLSLHIQGVSGAAVSVKNAQGTAVFSGSVNGDKALDHLPAGSYSISGGPVDGFVTPGDQTADLTQGDVGVTLNYVAAKASLKVVLAGVSKATVTIKNGASVVFSGEVTGGVTLNDLPRTVLTVTTSDVSGFVSPASQTVDLTSGSGAVTLTYITINPAMADLALAVTGPSAAAVQILQGSTVVYSGTVSGQQHLSNLPRAVLTVKAGDVAGYQTPAAQTVDLTSGSGAVTLAYSKANSGNQPSLTLSLPSSSFTVQAGASVQSDLSVSAQNVSTPVGLQLLGGPSGISLTPSQVAPNIIATLTLTASASTPAGTYALTLRGSAGAVTSDVPITLVVTSNNQVTLSITPASFNASVAAGGSVFLHGSVSSSTPQDNVYSSYGDLPSGVYVSSVQLSHVGSQPQLFSLTVNVPSGEAAGTYSGYIEFYAGTFNYVHVPFQLTVNAAGFVVKQDPQSPVSIYGGESANVPVTVQAVNGFSGQVTLQLSGLPSGVTQSAPVTVNLNGSDTAVNVSIAASANADIQDADVTVTGQSGGQSSQTTVTVKSRPRRVRIPTSSFAGISNPVAGPNDTAYVNTDTGVYAVNSSLQLSQLSTASLQCPYLTFGEDGGIWSDSLPYARLDPRTGQTQSYDDPRHYTGCAPTIFVDARRRVWDMSNGLYRLDLPNQTATLVPGTEGEGGGEIDIHNTTIWTVTDTNKLQQVDGDSLNMRTYRMPGVSYFAKFQAINNGIYFANNNQLAYFDTGAGTVTFTSIPGYQIQGLLGLDGLGGVWLDARTTTSFAEVWIHVILATNQVTRSVPAMVQSYGVTPGGGIFYTESDYRDNAAYLLYIAP